MITLRPSSARGHFNHGWLDTYHSFSFAEYVDPRHMGFRSLRVINEDHIEGGVGFPTHGHRDMEIITYVLDGAVAHKDSMGNSGLIAPGDVQRMSAGTGVQHSEYNGSDEATHLLQIWLLPKERGIAPGYEQKEFSAEEKRGKLRLIASPDARDGSVAINQDAQVYATLLGSGESVSHTLAPGRAAWVQVARGSATLNGQQLQQGDGAAIEDEPSITLTGTSDEVAELIVFDLV